MVPGVAGPMGHVDKAGAPTHSGPAPTCPEVSRARHADSCWVDTERLFMELEYKDDRRKGRFVILAGVVLALVAGGIAFYTINQAQQKANDPATSKISLVVAVATIPAREPVKAADVVGPRGPSRSDQRERRRSPTRTWSSAGSPR